ncbi:non-ribosomal peptide synthetase [Streptomyces profundus]|uniref:non-ribosomal peptide synthetase n=1 Tax=Streptomyces profundus TaxID=2867410 RepID=UPI001D15ECE4|nr:non-ribosomal peptide synthetase [Streptomyces sp. MA3_2.13]UED83917.1 amino acid adenylation domain-containing protein [Streptomyces sp. MA3_2.13]
MIYEFPVSPAQSRLLVLDRMHPGTAQYNVPAGFRVRGPFDQAAFVRALDALVARHESLRTVFPARATGEGGVPAQVVSATARAEVTHHARVPAGDVETRMLTEAARPFDTETGPLLRCSLYAVADGSHRVLLVAHHLVCDGWSLQQMLRELSADYAAFTDGPPERSTALPEPALQYPDYAVWQRERLAAGGYAEAVAHWAGQLAGAPDTTALPVDRPRPARRTTDGGVVRFVLPPATLTRVGELARARQGTPFMALLAAFAAFLGRLSDQDDLVVGVPVSGRDRPELHDMVGMLTNTLAIRCELAGEPSFAELIDRVRERLLAGQSHQDAPFEAVVDAVAPHRAVGHDPLVQVMFAYDDDTRLVLDLANTDTRRVELPLDTAKFDLLLYVERIGDELVASLIHSTDLIGQDTARRWVRAFETLLDSLLAAPDAPIRAATLLPADERDWLAKIGDRTAEAAPPQPLVPELIAAQAALRPEAPALHYRETTLSYRQLLDRADRLAARLRAAGVRPDTVVGLLLPRSVEMAVAALAVLRAGGAYLPLDPGHPVARLRYMVGDSAAPLLLADATTAPLADQLGPPVLRADVEQAVRAPAEPPPAPTPRNLAYLLYTSGSTGTPKGIAVEHRALANLCVAVRAAFPLDADDRVLQYVNFGFDVAVSDLFLTWTVGAELHIAGDDERLGEPLLARLRDSRISYVFLPPSAALSIPEPEGRLPDLRSLVVGGEACPAELVERWSAPGRRVVDAYGPSEATVYATTEDLRPGVPVAIGEPVPGARVTVLDSGLRPVPVGVTGEIHIAGASLGRGYPGRPGLTAQRFVADPYGPPGSRMYRTGDLGRFDADGRLHYLGRIDTQVKVRGFRVELGEIESVLAGHPDVAMAAADVRGEAADRHLAAYVVPAEGRRPTEAALRLHLAERLPSYMVPEYVTHLDELPLNRSGKVERARLPAPHRAAADPERPHVEPETDTQRRVAAVWAEVLGHDRIGAHDNFFDLGGNSVRLLAVLEALNEPTDGAPGQGLTLVDLFRHPSLAALAAHLDRPHHRPAIPDGDSDAARRGQDRRRRLTSGRGARPRKGSTP